MRTLALALLFGLSVGAAQYSSLNQITRENVAHLKVAWTYHTHALEPDTYANEKAAFEATPILVDGTLYLSTPFNQVIALDPATGAEKWKYDPQVDRSYGYSEVTSRGVSAWTDRTAAAGTPCRMRIFEGTIDARLIALDGKTGKVCGTVDLTQGVGFREDRHDYEVTSPPAVVGDMVIVGSSIGDNSEVSVERGVVRAFDARTLKLRWTWDPIPWAAGQKQRTGAANAWSLFAVDAARDLVFIPTGSASPDFYGGERPNDNRWANSVVALKASTGALVWGFQVVHHDLWDYDIPSQPTLLDFKGRPAVAVTTKFGHVFVLDRETGKPLSTVEERSVPKSDVPGEKASPTQPIPTWSAMVPQRLTAETVWGPTEQARQWCRDELGKLRNEGLFTPPSLQGTLVFPGLIGGVNWGGATWDPSRNLLLANTNRFPAVIKLIPRAELAATLKSLKEYPWGGEFGRQKGTPYAMHRDWLVSPAGLPCNAPPWGALVAFDLVTGKLRWEAPLGGKTATPTREAIGVGGPLATAGGLVFTAAAIDPHLRAFNSDTGEEIWNVELPASAQSTPASYEWEGKQYIVICAGGHGKLKSKMGDSVVAFRLE